MLPWMTRGGRTLIQFASTSNCTPGKQLLPHACEVGMVKLSAMVTGYGLRLTNMSSGNELAIPASAEAKS